MGEAGIVGGGKDGSLGVRVRGGAGDALARTGNPTGFDPLECAGEEEGVT